MMMMMMILMKASYQFVIIERDVGQLQQQQRCVLSW